MFDQQDFIVRSLYVEIMHELTPAGRKLLSVLLRHGSKRGMTRQDIAHLLGKNKLNRYDIQLLKLLEDKGYILVDRKQLYDDIGISSHGFEITPPTWVYLYTVNARFRPYFEEINERIKRAKSDPQPDSPSLFQRLRDLIS